MRYVRPLAAAAIALVLAWAGYGPSRWHEQVPAATPAASAMRVFIDPQTGKRRRPAPEELRAASQGRDKAGAQVPEVSHRDGMTFVRVPKERRMHLRAELDAHGRVRIAHGRAGEEP